MTFQALQQENEGLKAVVAELSLANQELCSEKSTLTTKLQSAQSEQERLKLVIRKLQHRLFGKSSERRIGDDPRQGSLFELPQAEEKAATEVPVAAHTKKIRKQFDEEEEAPAGTFPAHLRRADVPIDDKPEGIPEEDLELVSTKVTERLSATPGEVFVARITRRVFKQKSTGKMLPQPVVSAPGHMLDKRCKVTEEFLVLMFIKKFLWHLPLYRQQQELKLQGVKLSRDRLVTWTMESGALFLPIVKALGGLIRGAPAVHMDESPIVVGKEIKDSDDKKYDKGWLWPILAPDIGVVFYYRPTRAWANVAEILKDFSGTLISDAYDAYEDFVTEANIRWQLCWMHIRRNFVDAEPGNKELAKEAQAFIRKLYDVEAQFKNASVEKRALGRQQFSQPILGEFHKWLTAQSVSPAVLSDPLMSTAVFYPLNRWQAACLFVHDGALPIDNGAAERALRPSKLGAKNWLHCSSETGAETVAVFYSLIGSALMHGIHPYYYLLDLTKRLDDPTLKAEDLVPHRWKKRFFEEAVPEHLRNILTKGAPFIGNPDSRNFKKSN